MHDLNSDEIISGNQRMTIFDLRSAEVEIVEEYNEPDDQGTVAHGFVLWQEIASVIHGHEGRHHITQKPLDLPELHIEASCPIGGTVLDPFLGSGTTLIACERLNRKCRAVEISPAYCAVAIQRWVDMTGREPKLLSK